MVKNKVVIGNNEIINYHLLNESWKLFIWTRKFLNRSTNRAGVLRFFVPRRTSPFPTSFPYRITYEEKFRVWLRGGEGTSLMWIWIWSRISPPISFPRLSRVVRLRGERSSDFLSGALLGDRTVSDLSRALISRLSGVQSNMRESLFSYSP